MNRAGVRELLLVCLLTASAGHVQAGDAGHRPGPTSPFWTSNWVKVPAYTVVGLPRDLIDLPLCGVLAITSASVSDRVNVGYNEDGVRVGAGLRVPFVESVVKSILLPFSMAFWAADNAVCRSFTTCPRHEWDAVQAWERHWTSIPIRRGHELLPNARTFWTFPPPPARPPPPPPRLKGPPR